MMSRWSFGQKVGLGFAALMLLTLVIAGVAVYALRTVVSAKDAVVEVNARILIDTERLNTAVTEKRALLRSYLLDKQEHYLSELTNERAEVAKLVASLRDRLGTSEEKQLLEAVRRTEEEHQAAVDQIVALRRADTSNDVISKTVDEIVEPKRVTLTRAVDAFVAKESEVLAAAMASATRTSDSAILVVGLIAALAILLSLIVAVVLTRSLGRQIGTAVTQVQSSSAELQAAANQQATSTKEQATAMSEITTTITELLATSRQIAESAQRVAQIAAQTAVAAGTGDATVGRSHESIAGIRRQVDLIVGHMLELGKKSQQIGAVLDIVSELAEQTNILAINATIEAAGAGDAGKRFSVVADEIRKLADRVATSTKEIRGLIDDVRSAVNTTVMTTETGSKAVDTGTRHFQEVTSAFQLIAGLVGTTTEAAKEIELSTRQQATAVEQVNVAITNVAQATRETEASSGQTLQTASELGGLSRALMQIVQPQQTPRFGA